MQLFIQVKLFTWSLSSAKACRTTTSSQHIANKTQSKVTFFSEHLHEIRNPPVDVNGWYNIRNDLVPRTGWQGRARSCWQRYARLLRLCSQSSSPCRVSCPVSSSLTLDFGYRIVANGAALRPGVDNQWQREFGDWRGITLPQNPLTQPYPPTHYFWSKLLFLCLLLSALGSPHRKSLLSTPLERKSWSRHCCCCNFGQR